MKGDFRSDEGWSSNDFCVWGNGLLHFLLLFYGNPCLTVRTLYEHLLFRLCAWIMYMKTLLCEIWLNIFTVYPANNVHGSRLVLFTDTGPSSFWSNYEWCWSMYHMKWWCVYNKTKHVHVLCIFDGYIVYQGLASWHLAIIIYVTMIAIKKLSYMHAHCPSKILLRVFSLFDYLTDIYILLLFLWNVTDIWHHQNGVFKS